MAVPQRGGDSDRDPLARVLLSSLIDYAGLFPPAERDMDSAVQEFDLHRASAHSWMLGSFVVPQGRIEELVDSWRRGPGTSRWSDGDLWPLSVIVSGDPVSQDGGSAGQRFESPGIGAVRKWLRETTRGRVVIGSLEVRPIPVDAIEGMRERLPQDLEVFHEVPLDAEVEARLDAIAEAGDWAKLRTGGVEANMIPTVDAVARFLVACAERGVPMKATAGLHHAVRGEYPLTYRADSPVAAMHGFVNLTLAAALAMHGERDHGRLTSVLDQRDLASFVLERRSVHIEEHDLPLRLVEHLRRGFFHSFGSCSFLEPLEDLERAGWI